MKKEEWSFLGIGFLEGGIVVVQDHVSCMLCVTSLMFSVELESRSKPNGKGLFCATSGVIAITCASSDAL